jgi:PAS domain S-box-containing protein
MPRRKLRITTFNGVEVMRIVRAGAPVAAALIFGAIALTLEKTPLEIPHDFAAAIFGLLSVYAAFEGGALVGLVCGGIGWSILAAMLSVPRQFFTFADDDRVRLIVMAFALPVGAMLVSGLRAKMARDNALLRESEQMWRILAEHVPDVVMSITPKGVVHYLSRKLPWSGRAKAEVVGQPLADALPPDYRAQVRKLFPRVLSSGKEQRIELRLDGPEGVPAWYELRLGPVRRGEEVFAAIATITDMSRRLEEENAHERLVALVQSSNAAIFGATTDGTVTSWNPGARRMYGYAPDEIVGKHVSMLLPDGRAGEGASALIARAAAGERIDKLEMAHRKKDGAPIDVTLTVSPIGERGKVEGIAIIARDLTAQKRADAEQRRTLALLAEAERIAHVGSWEWDLASNAMTWTDELYRIYGLEPGAVRPSQEAYLRQIVTDDREKVKQAVRKAREESIPFSFDHRITRPDGTERVLRAHGTAQRNAAGKTVRLVGTVHDVTAYRKMEAELRSRRQALEEEARVRSGELRETEFKLRTVLSEAPLVVWAVDKDGVFTLSEGKGLAALHLKPGEVVGKSVYDVYKDSPSVIDNHRRSLAGETVKASLLVADRSYETTYIPLRGKEGGIIGVMGVAVDITGRKAG